MHQYKQSDVTRCIKNFKPEEPQNTQALPLQKQSHSGVSNVQAQTVYDQKKNHLTEEKDCNQGPQSFRDPAMLFIREQDTNGCQVCS